MFLNGNAFNLGFVNLSDPANQMINSVNNVVNLSAEKLFIMILLFSLFMFIFGLIIHLISSAVKIVSLWKKLDKAIGFISGVVKGFNSGNYRVFHTLYSQYDS